MARLSWVRSLVIAATIATAAAGCAPDNFVNPDFCVIQVARILPESPTLNIGDTITLRAEFNHVSADCLPRDTTAKSLRWVADLGGVVDIDSLTGHVTARKAGGTGVTAQGKYKGGYSGVGSATVTVLAP
jgi:uncharacterized protein YjdB